MSLPRARCQPTMASLRVLRQAAIACGRIGRQLDVLKAFGDADVVLVGHAAHAFAERAHEIQAGLR